MAVVSDIDWVILAAVAVFLLMGRGAGDVMRAFGRYYARAVRLKNELLAEVTRSAGLPPGQSFHASSIRQTLLGDAVSSTATPQAPLAVTVAPTSAPALLAATTSIGGSLGPPTWIRAESGPNFQPPVPP